MFKRLTPIQLNDFIMKGKYSKTLISEKIGMTQNGLHDALVKRQSLKLTTFQDICEVIQVHPASFFKSENERNEDAYTVKESEMVYERQASSYVPRDQYNDLKRRYEDEINYLRELNKKLIER